MTFGCPDDVHTHRRNGGMPAAIAGRSAPIAGTILMSNLVPSSADVGAVMDRLTDAVTGWIKVLYNSRLRVGV
ncbi:MAG: hypothetical protein AAF580_07900 [Pseudomonadota bacterium]